MQNVHPLFAAALEGWLRATSTDYGRCHLCDGCFVPSGTSGEVLWLRCRDCGVDVAWKEN